MRRRHKISFVIGNAISIHAPRAGCDYLRKSSPPKTDVIFQSTHPVRGATSTLTAYSLTILYFNPRTPCGVRRNVRVKGGRQKKYFNPRTPCGVRRRKCYPCVRLLEFQSTHPVRGATRSYSPVCVVFGIISIHAPRAGCDSAVAVFGFRVL